MTAATCPLCAEGRARIPRGSAFVHLGDVPSTIVGCGEQPGYDPDAFNRAVDAVIEEIRPWQARTATEAIVLQSSPPEPDYCDESEYCECLSCDSKREYAAPFAYSYSPCPVCTRIVLPGDETSGQMLGRPVHARCMAEYTADLDHDMQEDCEDHGESR